MAGRNFKPGQCSPHTRIRLSAAEREIMARRFEKAIVSSTVLQGGQCGGARRPPPPPARVPSWLVWPHCLYKKKPYWRCVDMATLRLIGYFNPDIKPII